MGFVSHSKALWYLVGGLLALPCKSCPNPSMMGPVGMDRIGFFRLGLEYYVGKFEFEPANRVEQKSKWLARLF